MCGHPTRARATACPSHLPRVSLLLVTKQEGCDLSRSLRQGDVQPQVSQIADASPTCGEGVPVRKPGVHILGLVSPSLGQLISRNTNQNSSSKSHFISFQISSLKTQIQSQESDLKSQEDDLNRAKSELNRLQQEETQLEQSIQAGKVQLETIIKSLKSTQDEINQVSKGAGWGRACHPWLGLGCGWDGASGVSCQAGWLPQAEQLQRCVRCSRCLRGSCPPHSR